jgi:nitroreductase
MSNQGGNMQEELFELIKTRRSVREFKSDPIPREVVLRLVEAASWAPSGSNQQPWRFVAVSSPQVKAQMSAAVHDAIATVSRRMKSERAREEFAAYSRYFTVFEHAPLVVCVYSEAYQPLIARLLARYGEEDEDITSTGSIQSCAAATENLLLMAHALRLGGCWMTGPVIAADAIAELLEVDPRWQFICAVALGYPAKVPQPPPRPAPDTLVKFM